MQIFFNNVFAFYDSLLPRGLDEIINRLQLLLNNPECGHRKGQKITIFWSNNHQGESFNIKALEIFCVPKTHFWSRSLDAANRLKFGINRILINLGNKNIFTEEGPHVFTLLLTKFLC